MSKHAINGLTICTACDFPPLPIRQFDWSAVLDNYDGADDSSTRYQVGHGATEAEAIDDLLDLLNDEVCLVDGRQCDLIEVYDDRGPHLRCRKCKETIR